jgi:hypothetical protein
MDGSSACLSSGALSHYLDIETGDVIDTRETMSKSVSPHPVAIGDRRSRCIPGSARRQWCTRSSQDGDFAANCARRKLDAPGTTRNDCAIAAMERWLREIGVR